MTHYVKAWILALGLILTPAAAFAQDALPAAPDVDAAPVTASVESEAPAAEAAPASGLDPALYTPMKPTEGVGLPVNGGLDFQPQVSPTGEQAKWINNAILLPIIVGICLFVDRKSTRLNSSHVKISYAVFCLKKKNNIQD